MVNNRNTSHTWKISFHTNINGRVEIYFVAKYDTSSVLEEKHNYIQAGDRQLLTAKRSLEKEKEEWSSLLHWAVLHILGGGQTCTN